MLLRINSVVLSHGKDEMLRCAGMCENYAHGSTELTTNEDASLKFKHLAVRPEPSSKGSDRVFTQSGAQHDTDGALVDCGILSPSKIGVEKDLSLRSR